MRRSLGYCSLGASGLPDRTTILDPADARADELAAAYHQRWEEETANDQLKTHLRGIQSMQTMGVAVGSR